MDRVPRTPEAYGRVGFTLVRGLFPGIINFFFARERTSEISAGRAAKLTSFRT